jgi:hypothetical protein
MSAADLELGEGARTAERDVLRVTSAFGAAGAAVAGR